MRSELDVDGAALDLPLGVVVLAAGFLSHPHAEVSRLFLAVEFELFFQVRQVFCCVPAVDTIPLDDIEYSVLIHLLQLLSTTLIILIAFLLESLHHLIGLLRLQELDGQIVIRSLHGDQKGRELPHLERCKASCLSCQH